VEEQTNTRRLPYHNIKHHNHAQIKSRTRDFGVGIALTATGIGEYMCQYL